MPKKNTRDAGMSAQTVIRMGKEQLSRIDEVAALVGGGVSRSFVARMAIDYGLPQVAKRFAIDGESN